MTIRITGKEFVCLDPNEGYRAFQDGDDICSCYYHITLSNDFDFYVCGWWNTKDAEDEINKAVASANQRVSDSEVAAAAAQDLLESL